MAPDTRVITALQCICKWYELDMVQSRYLYKLTHFLPTGTCCGAICCSSCSHCISTWSIVLRKAKIIVGTKVHRMDFLIRHATKENYPNNFGCLDMPSYFPQHFFFSKRAKFWDLLFVYRQRNPERLSPEERSTSKERVCFCGNKILFRTSVRVGTHWERRLKWNWPSCFPRKGTHSSETEP